MLLEYQLTNFKAFAGPVTIPIRPITLIFGANSSGKSSIFQSLLLLKQTLEEAKDPDTTLLYKGASVDLGSYHDVVHRHENERDIEFRVKFDLEEDLPEEDIGWDLYRLILDATESSSIGLHVKLRYDESMSATAISSAGLHLGAYSKPVINYVCTQHAHFAVPPLFKHASSRITSFEIDTKSDFWRVWWNTVKTYIEDPPFGHDVILPPPKRDTIYESYEQLLEDLRDYSFEQAIHDFKKRLCYSNMEYKNFLPSWLDSYYGCSRRSGQLGLQYWLWARSVGKFSETRRESFPLAETELSDYVEPDDDQGVFDSPLDLEIEMNGQRCPAWESIISPLLFNSTSMLRKFLENTVHVGPLRNAPERYYVFSGDSYDDVGKTGGQFPHILFSEPETLSQVNDDLKHLGVNYSLSISKLHHEDSTLSNVFSLRLIETGSGMPANIQDVGFGISQVLPIVVQSRLSENKTLLIEQPEIHLHPAQQSELGDVFLQSALGGQNNTFLLETHSEHLILRIMRRMRERYEDRLPDNVPPVTPNDVAILYVERDGDHSIVREMPLNERGELVKAWPGGFFEEGLREILA